jgi:hypothetical protein
MFACPAAASPLCRRKVPFGRAGLLGMGEVRTREFRGVGNMGTYPYEFERACGHVIPSLSFEEIQKRTHVWTLACLRGH